MSPARTVRPALLALLLLLLPLLTGGCEQFTGSGQTEAATPTAAAGTPEATPLPETGAGDLPPQPQTDLRLIVWTTPDIAPSSDVPGGELLAAQLAEFDSINLGLTLDVAVKATSGTASSLNYLRAGHEVAPSILPDLLILPARLLPVAVREGLLYPLAAEVSGGPLTEEMIADLVPAAAQLGRLGTADGPLYGYPFAIDSLTHLVFNATRVQGAPPATWEALLNGEDSLVLAGDGEDGTRLVLQLYLAAGGRLATDTGQPLLELAPLQQALTLLEQGRRAGVIVLESTRLQSTTAVWQSYLSGSASLALLNANFEIDQRLQGDSSAYAPVPGPENALAPLVDGWVWVVATPDPVRQQRAMELIAWLTAAENLGPWSLESRMVPARRSALAAWGPGDDYYRFLAAELDRAAPFPIATSSAVLDALAIAAIDVLSLTQPPAAAAQEAVDALRP